MKIVTVEQMREIEAASDRAGHSYAAMMEQAGRAVADAIIARHDVRDESILILVGPGNNGGDGLVAARHLTQAGARVTCYLYQSRDSARDDMPTPDSLHEDDAQIVLADDDEDWRQLRQLTRQSAVIVDALLGTGVRLPLQGRLADMLDQVRQALKTRPTPQAPPLTWLTSIPNPPPSNAPVIVAVDGPSGLDHDSGALDPRALRADLTVTFAYPKRGHFEFPGAGALGDLLVADIGTPKRLADDVTLELVTADMARQWLPSRPPDAHKGTFGKALVIAGSTNYTGAAYLAGSAATRAGAGLVTLAIPEPIHTAMASRLAEATYLPLPQVLGHIASHAASMLQDHLAEYDALLLGPGLGQHTSTATFVQRLLLHTPQSDTPLVIDADGLNILARAKAWFEKLPSPAILTPHPGEMARLMGTDIQEVQDHRVEVAQAQARQWGHVIVLKGAYTVVAAPDGRTVIAPFATPGLATAGTGDVLAGAIVALRAQGLDAFPAAAAGAYLHGLAGELAQRKVGTAGMVAGDVLEHLPEAWRRLARG